MRPASRYRVAGPPPARALAARRLAACLCALLAAAAAALALDAPSSPSAFAGVARVQPERTLSVSRRVGIDGRQKLAAAEGLREASDETLHQIIAEERKRLFEFRLDVFRKKRPGKMRKHKPEYRIALAKTLLKQRELDANAKAAQAAKDAGEEEEPLVMSDLISQEESVDAFRRFAYRGGKSVGNTWKVPVHKMGQHYSEESKAWAAENLPQEEPEVEDEEPDAVPEKEEATSS